MTQIKHFPIRAFSCLPGGFRFAHTCASSPVARREIWKEGHRNRLTTIAATIRSDGGRSEFRRLALVLPLRIHGGILGEPCTIDAGQGHGAQAMGEDAEDHRADHGHGQAGRRPARRRRAR